MDADPVRGFASTEQAGRSFTRAGRGDKGQSRGPTFLVDLPYAVASFGARILTPDDRVFGVLRTELVVGHRPPLPFAVGGAESAGVMPSGWPGCWRARTARSPRSAVLRGGAAAEGYWFGWHQLADAPTSGCSSGPTWSVAHPRPGERWYGIPPTMTQPKDLWNHEPA